MINMNPIIKSEPYKYKFWEKLPVVSNNAALVFYVHDSSERCQVYFPEDTIYKEALKKWRFDRLACISLGQFEFEHELHFPFSNGVNQWANIKYKFVVSIKRNKDAIKHILTENITDLSEPILECIELMTLDRSYISLELVTLEIDALKMIKSITSELTYLKIQISQASVIIDNISKKQIDEDKADRLREVEINTLQKELTREKEMAKVRRIEAEIEREKVETQRQLALLRRQTELEEQEHDIVKKTKEVAAQKAYQLQQAENDATIAQVQKTNIDQYGLETLIAINSNYKKYIDAQQNEIDRERDNKSKDLELGIKKLEALDKAVESQVISQISAEQVALGELLKENTEKAILKNSSENKYPNEVYENGNDVK